MKRRLAGYLAISFLWTWGGWISAYLISARAGFSLSTDATLFSLFTDFPVRTVFWAQLIFALGVYGPLIGFLIAAPKRTGSFFGHARPGQAALFLAIPLAVALPGALISVLSGYFDGARASYAAVAIYFVSNLVTSGTEEFGWRGFLYPYLKEGGKSFWNTSWKSGLIWAVWHYPLMFILYWGLGPAALVSTLAGFTATIIAMAYISNYVFEKTGSIALCMLLHALNNTISFTVALFFPLASYGLLLGIASWVVVAILDKANQPQAKSAQGT
jgi:membrane protease YdiL (CAAX protease family)